MRLAVLALLAALLPACAPPARPACDATPEPGALGSICGFDHPEDLELVAGAGLVLASGLEPGAGLWAIAVEDLARPDPRPWRIWPAERAPPETGRRTRRPRRARCRRSPGAFMAHGLTTRTDPASGAATVAVVGHGEREAIELFESAGRAVPPPSLARLRSAPAGRHGQRRRDRAGWRDRRDEVHPVIEGIALRYQALRASVGFESGEVLAWRRDRGWRAVAGTRGAGPNGLVLSADGELIYFAENGRHRIVRVPRAGGSPEFAVVASNVDNVGWADGRLLAVVHKGGAAPCSRRASCTGRLGDRPRKPRVARDSRPPRRSAVRCHLRRKGRRSLPDRLDERDRVGVWQPR